jgi:hypothetical protein
MDKTPLEAEDRVANHQIIAIHAVARAATVYTTSSKFFQIELGLLGSLPTA